MKERPILFSAPMVRAILAGTKTQTRRVIKPQPISNGFGKPGEDTGWEIPCYQDSYPPSAMLWPGENGGMLNGDAGHPWLGVDALWVRETWAPRGVSKIGGGPLETLIAYRADGAMHTFPHHEITRVVGEWKPSIFMPRWASRITLEIVDVRVERLQDITPADCRAEGMPHENNDVGVRYGYGQLWNQINESAVCGWNSNPWVWAISFRRL